MPDIIQGRTANQQHISTRLGSSGDLGLTPCPTQTPDGSRGGGHTARSLEMITAPATSTPTPRRNAAPASRLKCGFWICFAIIMVFLTGAKYYFHGVNIGMETFALCLMVVIVLIAGGLISLYEAITATVNARGAEGISISPQTEDRDEEPHNQVPTTMPPASAELPPPPYHIAIMLPSQNDVDSIQVIRDSPPPTYEKAVT